jgi:hypothetical protein
MTKARLEEVIIVESNRGLGVHESDPVRKVTSIFLKDGTLLAEIDSTEVGGIRLKQVFNPQMINQETNPESLWPPRSQIIDHKLMAQNNMTRGDQLGVPVDPYNPSRGVEWKYRYEMTFEDDEKIKKYFELKSKKP